MLRGTSQIFKYIKIERDGNRYFSLQQSLFVLIWILYYKKDPIRPNKWPEFSELFYGHPIGWLRHYFWTFRENFKVLMNFACYKYHLRKIEAEITVSFPGQICLPIHKGLKVFDYRKGIVVKVFDKDTEASMILGEVERLRNISSLPFAPSIKQWNIEEKWYEEDYVDGEYDFSKIPLDSKNVLHKFCTQLVPHIKRLMLFQKPKPRSTLEYTEEIIAALDISRLKYQEISAREASSAKNFINDIAAELHNKGNHTVQLVFTHGDFCPANMLNTKDGLIVVDWESAKYRSALFDFYSYFFHRHACRNVAIDNVAFEIKEGLTAIISELNNSATEISTSLLNLGKFYRWIFYLEYVSRLIEREATDKDLNVSRFLIGYIDSFKKYEKTVTDE